MIEKTILSHLVYNEDYARKVLPFLKDEYFISSPEKLTFQLIANHIRKYNKLPTRESLLLDADAITGVSEETHKTVVESLKILSIENTNIEYLIDATEKFCQQKALYNAIMQSIHIMEDKDKKLSKDSIPTILQDALGVCFDPNVGHDYIDEADARFDYYHRVENHVPFDIELLNTITKGGFTEKTLNVFMSPPHAGKTLVMCHMAAANLYAGHDVLYITLEMAEEKIAERIDANLLNIPIAEMENIPKSMFDDKIVRLKSKTLGKLIIKEYPTASAHAGHFRHLLNELRLKKNFIPKIIYIDYLNICTSSRIKLGNAINTYSLVKSIAEELRGLAIEFRVPIVTATQTNRDGVNNSDIDMTNTAESMGLPATADLLIALISSEEMAKLNQLMFKQLKNRYTDLNLHTRFVVGVDRAHMRLYDVEQQAQDLAGEDNRSENVPVFERSTAGQRVADESKTDFKKVKFLDFK